MSDTLQEYLIALGFKVDDASYKKFKAAVATGAKEAAGLGAVAVSTATAIGLSVEKIAREYEGLYYASQRTRTSVNDLKSYSFAMKQIGLDAGASSSALESFTTAQRLNPGIKGFVGLSGGTGANPVEQMTNFVEQQKKLYGESGYYVAAMNAQLAGIPEATFFQIWHNLPKLRAANAEMNRMRQEAGLSGRELTDKSVEFINAWDHLLGSLDIGKDRITSDLIGPVETGVKVIDEVVQAFNRADVSTKGWLGSIIGVTSALGGTAAALSVVLRILGMGGVAAAGARGAFGLAARGLLLGTNPWVAGGAAAYYGLGLNSATAGKEDDEPLSKEYRAKHGGGTGSLANANRNQIRDAMVQYFQAQGYSRAAAIGIAANAGAESGFDPKAVGDNGHSVGLFQWGEKRQAQYRAAFGKELRDASPEEQWAFAAYEMDRGADPQARRAGEKLRHNDDPYESGVIMSGLFERPAAGDIEAHRRGLEAQKWYDTPLAPAAAGGAVTINQTNNTNVTSPDAHAAGSAVGAAQDRANGDLVRNFQGAAR